MKNKLKIAGLHLWEISVEYRDGITRTITLWITTRSNSSVVAATKALSHLKRHRYEWPCAKLKSLTSRGTLDA